MYSTFSKKYNIEDICFNLKSYNNLNGTTCVYGKCVYTGKMYSCIVPTDGFNKWLNGGHRIQEAMCNVSDLNRKFILSGISPEGWIEE